MAARPNAILLAMEASHIAIAQSLNELAQDPPAQLIPPWAQQLLAMSQQTLLRMQGIEQQMQGIEQQMRGFELKLLDQSDYQICRLYNSTCRHDIDVLQPLAIPRLAVVPGNPHAAFPATVGAARGLNNQQLLLLLPAYGLPADGNTPVRRTRFLNFIGVV